jgi:hypothetical protein
MLLHHVPKGSRGFNEQGVASDWHTDTKASMEDEQGAGDKSRMGIVSSTLMIEGVSSSTTVSRHY